MFENISFKSQILLGFLTMISLMTVISGSSLINLSNTKRDLSEINNTLLPNALLMGQMARDIVLVHQFLSDVSASHSPAAYRDAEKSAQDFKLGLVQFRQSLGNQTRDNPQKAKEIDLLDANFDLFYQDGKQMASAYISQGQEAGNAAMQEFDHQSYKLSSQIIRLRNNEVSAVKQYVSAGTETATQATNALWIISLTAILLALAIALWLTRHLSKQIGIDPFYAKGIAKEIAAGNLSRSIKLDEGDKDSLLHAIKNMQQKMQVRRAAEHKTAEEILRIKSALDCICTGVMITDNDRNIIYVNNSALTILGKTEADIHQQVSNFSIANLVGTNIDDLHKNPAHQAQLLSSLTGAHKADIVLGDRSMTMTANPIVNEQGQRLGTVAEWYDRTAEVAVEKEVAALVVAGTLGDFTKRFDLRGKEGFLRELGEGLNQLLYASETGLNEVTHVLGALSRCDLTATISNDYEGTFGQLKDNANTTVATLKNIIYQIKDATDSINTGSAEIASGNNDLSQRTELQAASLQQTATSMGELTAIVQQNAENAKQTNLLAMGAAEIAGQGGVVVAQVIDTMNNIKESSRKIEEIVSILDDIAFQTNILAFNASVQAAHAGVYGQGFAVVASEVRHLAQRAAVSAEDIKNLIDDSVRKIDGGSKLAAQAGKTMEEVLSSIRGVSGMMSEITAASVEQSAGIEQINQAIGQMDNVTQQNAALVEQAAAAAESLEEQAQNLIVMVGGFKIDEKPAHPNALYVAEDNAALPEFHLSHHHRGYRQHSPWDAGRANSSHVFHHAESTAKPQLLAVANGDWEEF
ncbi:MAG: methyl-accepting chemotaxis protein [Methylobacter sp.]|nr:methyl-accepting chemotaxis protein [Methylobacter sp.]